MSQFPQSIKVHRRAISLIELLVSIAIVGILLSLIIPAVQMTRESSRRLQCQSSLRQIGLGVENYHSIHQIYPAGVGDAGSFLFTILPLIEEAHLYHALLAEGDACQLNSTRAVAPTIFRCPTETVDLPWGTNYSGNLGALIQRDGANGMFRHLPIERGIDPYHLHGNIKHADVIDGVSHTALIAETLIAPFEVDIPSNRVDWITLETFIEPEEVDLFLDLCDAMPEGHIGINTTSGMDWCAGGMFGVLYTHHLPPNHPRCMNGTDYILGAYTSGSLHPGGANVLYADGHIRFQSTSTDRMVWHAIGSRNGRETTTF